MQSSARAFSASNCARLQCLDELQLAQHAGNRGYLLGRLVAMQLHTSQTDLLSNHGHAFRRFVDEHADLLDSGGKRCDDLRRGFDLIRRVLGAKMNPNAFAPAATLASASAGWWSRKS